MTPETQALIGTIVTAAMPVLLAWIAFQQAKLKTTMVTLEKNTNSIKDELVKTTSDASHAEGVKDEKDRQQFITTAVEEAKKIAP